MQEENLRRRLCRPSLHVHESFAVAICTALPALCHRREERSSRKGGKNYWARNVPRPSVLARIEVCVCVQVCIYIHAFTSSGSGLLHTSSIIIRKAAGSGVSGTRLLLRGVRAAAAAAGLVVLSPSQKKKLSYVSVIIMYQLKRTFY